MSEVVVLVPHGAVPADLAVPVGCRLVTWHTADDVVRSLAGGTFQTAVLVVDGLDSAGLVEQAVRQCGRPVILVRSQQWDGFSELPLAADCKGVVSGFGIEGAVVAARNV